jgi:hypothetical protein
MCSEGLTAVGLACLTQLTGLRKLLVAGCNICLGGDHEQETIDLRTADEVRSIELIL